jgi:hypothetical protein
MNPTAHDLGMFDIDCRDDLRTKQSGLSLPQAACSSIVECPTLASLT